VTPTPSIADVARKLSDNSEAVLRRRGIAYGRTFFDAALMRPLEKAGLMERREMPKGFRPTWAMTAASEAVRQHLIEQESAK